MHQRGRRHHRLVGVALLLALLFAPGTSWARHTERTPVTIDSAYTLDYHEWRVSVWRVECMSTCLSGRALR